MNSSERNDLLSLPLDLSPVGSLGVVAVVISAGQADESRGVAV